MFCLSYHRTRRKAISAGCPIQAAFCVGNVLKLNTAYGRIKPPKLLFQRCESETIEPVGFICFTLFLIPAVKQGVFENHQSAKGRQKRRALSCGMVKIHDPFPAQYVTVNFQIRAEPFIRDGKRRFQQGGLQRAPLDLECRIPEREGKRCWM